MSPSLGLGFFLSSATAAMIWPDWQAPHWAMPQPNLGPFTSSTSRNTQSRGISGSTSALRFLPLTVSSIIWDLLGLSVMQYCKSRFSWSEQFTSSNEAQTLVRERQRADALAGRGEDRVAQRRGERRERRLAHPAPEPAARDEHRLDTLRHLGHSHDAVVVEVGLLDAALAQGDLAPERRGEPVGDTALHLRLRRIRIHHVARIDRHHHAPDVELARIAHRYLEYRGGIAPVRVLHSDAAVHAC